MNAISRAAIQAKARSVEWASTATTRAIHATKNTLAVGTIVNRDFSFAWKKKAATSKAWKMEATERSAVISIVSQSCGRNNMANAMAIALVITLAQIFRKNAVPRVTSSAWVSSVTSFTTSRSRPKLETILNRA